MNKIVQLGFIIVVASMLNACCSTAPVANCGSATDTFRIGLHYSNPQYPSCLGPSSHGPDVANWQRFLQAKGFGLTEDNSDRVRHDTTDHPYPGGKDAIFDRETEEATMRFQASRCYGKHQIAITGTVNSATFKKAVRAGLPNYAVVIPHEVMVPRTPGVFRYPMESGCTNVSGTWDDVGYWQSFLVSVGELTMNPITGTFGSTTQIATENFQSDYGVVIGGANGDVSGVVGKNTFNMAVQWGMHAYSTSGDPISPPCN